MANNLFLLVMEAEGDLVEPFDGGTDAPPEDTAPPEQSPSPDGMDEPPALNDDAPSTVDAFDASSGEDAPSDGDDQSAEATDDQTDDGNANDTKLSDKANAVLNQRLYQQMVDRNQEIDDILANIAKITPVLPYEVIKLNEEPTTRLRAALNKGKDYVLDKFIDSKYGENLMFFQKLDALYSILLNCIDENLKKYEE